MVVVEPPEANAPSKHAGIETALRIVLGLTMLVVGILKFAKPDFKVADDATLRAFVESGWLWQLIGAAEMIGGAALLSGLYVPLGLAVLAPVVAGIAAFAIKVGGEETSVGFTVLGAYLYLVWRRRSSFTMLTRRHS